MVGSSVSLCLLRKCFVINWRKVIATFVEIGLLKGELNHTKSRFHFILIVYSYHVTYTFQIKSTICSCLNVKKLLARNRREIWSLSDCNGTRTHNHLVLKRTLNHLAKLPKWLNCVVGSSPVAVTFVLVFLIFLICYCCISNEHHNPTSWVHLRIQLSPYQKFFDWKNLSAVFQKSNLVTVWWFTVNGSTMGGSRETYRFLYKQ